MPLELRALEEGQDRLADAGRVRRHRVADTAIHADRVGALDLLDVDDVRAAHAPEVDGLAARVGQRAERRAGLAPQVDALEELVAEAAVGHAEDEGAALLVEPEELSPSERLEYAVRRRLAV